MTATTVDSRAPGRSAPLFAVLIPACAWCLTLLSGIAFIWRALGKVNARHAFLQEVADYVLLAVVPSLIGSALVIPVAICVKGRRVPAGAWMVALGVLSLLTYGATSFLALAYYSLRIT